jgi:hypothetical protein
VTYAPPRNPRINLVPALAYPYRRDQSHIILVSSFALIQNKSHSLNFVVLTICSILTVRHSSGDVPPGSARGLDHGPYDVARDTDKASKDGGYEPADHARGELPRRRGLPPSSPPLLLQQLCLHPSFVPGTLIVDTSTVRSHCVRSIPDAPECFLHQRCMFFLPSYIL